MRSFGVTDKGLMRELNEDHYFCSTEPVGSLPNLFIVTDGMGGHNAGDVAARRAVEYTIAYIREHTKKPTEQVLLKAVEYANYHIYKDSLNQKDLKGMGTTLVACSILNEQIVIVNVGDSRVYRISDNMVQVTVDHSFVEELIKNGAITREEGQLHPDRNKITRAVGAEISVQADLFTCERRGIKYILICSDGLTKMVEDHQIEATILSDERLIYKGKSLIEQAMVKGGRDNITIILVDLNDSQDNKHA